MSGKGKSILNQSSKSTSSKKRRNKRDIISTPPHREFPATTSTFSGLAGKLMKYGTLKPMLSIIAVSFVLLGFTTIIYSSNSTYASSISISLTGNVNLNILKNNTNPTFGKSTAQTATVTSDHFTGYTLTIAGSNDTGRLVGSNDSTKYLSSITTPLTESQFNTDTHNDQWGFLPSKLNSITNNSYQPSPTATTPTTIDVTSSPTDNDGNDYTLALASRISPNMPLDSYGQTFVLAATGNGYDYYIGYTDDLNDMPENQLGTNTTATYVNISSTTPTKAGYVFAGWCDQKTTNNGTTCPGTTYPAGQRIDLDGTSANHYDLHAIWDPVTFAEAGATNMQSMTTAICNAVAIGQEATLSDTRGGSYRVGKMKDGHCWMLDNLALGRTQLTPSDTNISENYIFPTNATTWDNSYTDAKINTDYINATPDTTLPESNTWKVGVYYNYCAATAGTYCPAELVAGILSGQDICPKGWRMPSGGHGSEYQAIWDAYSNNYTNFRTALRLPLSGYYSSAQAHYQGSRGDYGSSTYHNAEGMYDLRILTSEVSPSNAYYRTNGFSVRCIAK